MVPRFFSPLALGVALVIAVPKVHSATLSADCVILAQGSAFQDVGDRGQGGATGANGQDGASAEDVTIFSDGSPMTLNLSGRDGEAGQGGGNGLTPSCPPLNPNQRQNVRLADGGLGGDGGNGGNGGNGGSLTIYSRNINNLKQVFVTAAGGRGGDPGMGGTGSAGCACPQPYWNVETCTGRPGDANYRCSTQEFTCQSGRDGRNGRAGVAGKDGLPGRLTVLNLDRPLESDRPVATVPLQTLRSQGFTLSKNQWETRQGAAQLLAPGSVIADEYLVLTDRVERSFLLLWNAPQSFDPFANGNANLRLNENQQVAVEFPGDLWLEGTTQQRNTVTEYVVYNAMWAGDAKKLGRLTLSGNGRNLRLFVTDEAAQSSLMATKFRLKYRITNEDPRFRPPSTYNTRFDGPVPDEAVVVNGNQFTINLGALPIEDKDLQPGLGVEIELYADRTFSTYQAEQRLALRDVIKPGGSVPVVVPDRQTRPAPVQPRDVAPAPVTPEGFRPSLPPTREVF